MVFKEKLELLLHRLSASNVDLAKASTLDPSLISRFKTGSRIPSRCSEQLTLLSIGLVELAFQNERSDALRDILGVEEALAPEALQTALHGWLNAEDSQLRPQRKPLERERQTQTVPGKMGFYAFSDKLDSLMNLLEVSNIRLARTLNVDASLISRFRTGVRTPSLESPLLAAMAQYFAGHAKSPQQIQNLREMLDLTEAEAETEDPAAVEQRIFTWLTEKREEHGGFFMDSFLEKLDTFDVQPTFPPLPPGALEQRTGSAVTSEKFYGNRGLRTAVVNFLSLAVQRELPATLHLYSDQSMEWLTEDSGFVPLWSGLMAGVIRKGYNIRIIHTLNRGLPELLKAIEAWLPLYMTGQIEPFYYRLAPESLFRKTLFLAENVAAIHSSMVAGTESAAQHCYTRSPEDLDYYGQQFEALLKLATPLMQIYTRHTMDKYLIRLAEFEIQPGRFTSLTPSLPLSTMSRDLLTDLLTRSHVPYVKQEEILTYHDIRVNRMMNHLLLHPHTEIAVLPTDEALYSGTVKVDIPHYLLETPITYTPKDFSRHVEHLLHLLETQPHYRFTVLPEAPFHNIHIGIKEGVGTLITKSDPPMAVFLISNPQLRAAFESYLHHMQEMAESLRDAESVQSDLYRYLILEEEPLP